MMIREKIKSFQSNTLLANSFYLMLASGAVAGFGFIFWAVIARNFQDSQVGIAATLLSLSSLISLLSLAGFDTTFVRFLPKSNRRQDYINSGLIIAGGLSTIISLLFIILFPIFMPDLAFVSHSFMYSLAFIFFNVFTTFNTLTNSIFLAYRSAIYIFIVNFLFSVIKVALPFLAFSGGAMFIFTISGVAQVIGALLSFWIMAKKFGHVFLPKVHMDILRLSRKYSFSVYGSSVLNLLPPTLLPLIITHQLGPESSAYFYMAFTIAAILYTVAYSSMQSVFAESSHSEDDLRVYLKKAGKVLGVIMAPAIILFVIGAPFILRVFGANYADDGTILLQLFSISAIFVAVYSALGTVFKIKNAVRSLLLMNVAYATVIIGTTYILVSSIGLAVVGIAWMAGNIAAIVTGFLYFKFSGGR